MRPEDVYAGLQPKELWRHFAALNRCPRPSRQEGRARDYVLQQAAAAGAPAVRDAYGNVVVHVPASPGRESAPVLAIQAHLDMVCEKRPGLQHDFATDPIRPQRQGGWISATGTTLGADNGIGASAALVLLTDASVSHGPLDLIFTVEEEIGLNGAAALDPSALRARMLLNLDSEDPSELTIGCAGGGGTVLRLQVGLEAAPAGTVGRELTVSGLRGGHSGVQIHERRANAIKLLVRALQAAGTNYRLASFRGGNAHNAIPRDAAAVLAVTPAQDAALRAAVNSANREIGRQWLRDEPGLKIAVRDTGNPETVLTERDAAVLLTLLDQLPHGVVKMSEVFEGKVETSSNLAQVDTVGDCVTIGTSSRSFVDRECEAVQERIAALGRAAGATLEVREGYSGWEPNPSSELVRITADAYERSFGKRPVIRVIHAGLECGVIAAKVPGMEAVSFGPRIRDAHTPEERVETASVQQVWQLLCAVLAAA